jgi:DNA polymerase
MTILRIDVETYSSIDIKDHGAYKYVDSDDFEILLFGYAFDDGPVNIIDLTDFEAVPDEVMQALTDPSVIKTAFNANFERLTIGKHFGIYCDPLQWRCTKVHAAALGLPNDLARAAKVLGLDDQKDSKGKALIKYFSCPCKPSKANGWRERNEPHHAPEKWQQYIEYCRQDVVVEREVSKRLAPYKIPDFEWKLWALDQRINDRGVKLDETLFLSAIECAEAYKLELLERQGELTGLDNPNALPQLKAWLHDQGIPTPDGITKESMPALAAEAMKLGREDVREVLRIRGELGKTSVDKYDAMRRALCRNGRAHGLLEFLGAGRTWRWAGRLIQVQNLPQNKVKDLALARQTLREGEHDLLELLYGAPPFILSQLVRTAFIPASGRFVVDDFAAIEARVIAWVADEEWVLEVFRTHGKIYEATAAQMYGVPWQTIVKGEENDYLRPKGKIAVLACGFGGGVNALIKMGALRDGLTEDELGDIVKDWRTANAQIARLWKRVERAAIEAVRKKSVKPIQVGHGVSYRMQGDVLLASLPSGRSLAYQSPRLEPNKNFGGDELTFMGKDQQTGQWVKHRTWGGTLVENFVQAIARDCLAVAMMRLDAAGYDIVMHVHDEIIIDSADADIEEITRIMSEPIPWAPGLPLTAEGFECTFYQKD